MILDWPKNACTFLELLAKQKVKAWVVICVLNCGLWLLIREVRGVKFISRLYPNQSRDSSLRNVIVNSKVAFLSCPGEAVPDYMSFLMNHKKREWKDIYSGYDSHVGLRGRYCFHPNSHVCCSRIYLSIST